MKRRLRIYLAAELFDTGAKYVNIQNAKLLRSFGFRCFVPQELSLISPTASPEAKHRCYLDDLKAIMQADVMIVCANSIDIDSGASAELGMGALMYEQKISFGIQNGSRILVKPLVFKDDLRMYYSNSNLNNFVEGCAHNNKAYNNVSEMIPLLKELQESITEEEGSVVYGIAQYDYKGDIQPTKELEELTMAVSAADIEESNKKCE